MDVGRLGMYLGIVPHIMSYSRALFCFKLLATFILSTGTYLLLSFMDQLCCPLQVSIIVKVLPKL